MMNNKPIIILDGGEQQGKSYLANRLSKLFNIPMVHFDAPHTYKTFDFFEDYFTPIHKAKKGIIIDRSFMSAICYDRLFDRCDFPLERIEPIERRFNALRATYVILDIPKKEWLAREELISEDQNKLVKKYFKEQLKASTIKNKFYINPLDEAQVNSLIKHIKDTYDQCN